MLPGFSLYQRQNVYSFLVFSVVGPVESKAASGKRGPPANVAFGGTLTATRPRVPAATLGRSQPGSPAKARPRQVSHILPASLRWMPLHALKDSSAAMICQTSSIDQRHFKRSGRVLSLTTTTSRKISWLSRFNQGCSFRRH